MLDMLEQAFQQQGHQQFPVQPGTTTVFPLLRQLPQAEDPIDTDRVANVQPATEALGVVVGELVDDREGPHLEPEERRVAGL